MRIRRPHKKEFTREDDELIVRCAHGEITIKSMETLVAAGRRKLEERAAILGVDFSVHRQRRMARGVSVRRTIALQYHREDGLPYVCDVGSDPLLAALHLHHPERAK